MNDWLVIFTLDERHFALRLSATDRVVRAVAITPLPQAPEIVSGIIDLHGDIVPVINLRRRFRMPERDIALGDQIVIAHTARRTLGLVVDEVTGVAACPEQDITAAGHILPGLEYIEGIARLPDGPVFIHDLDKSLALEEEVSLAQALQAA